ncbi:MAG TPA: HlyD family secretion protein [Pirellulales bacterium]|jgi:membrane fusion protein (multidrug efflux system)|nr:HlyD family secretion protein [Pirellulales bacterium]
MAKAQIQPAVASPQPAMPPSIEPHPVVSPQSQADGNAAAISATPRRHRRRKWLIAGAAVIGIAILVLVGIPMIREALTTVSTDDAYVNGHVTFVAPRVAGQVTQVLVDDNNRVRAGDLLVQLDPKPYQVQVELEKAALDAAKTDLAGAQSQVRGYAAQARSLRFKLQHTIEDIDNQIALLRAKVAQLATKQATLARAKADYERGKKLVESRAIAQEDFDQRQAAFRVAEADMNEALEEVYQSRASLGLPREPPDGKDLSQVPPDLDQTASAVREALYAMIQSAALLGVYPSSYELTPKRTIEEFMRRDPSADVNRIYEKLLLGAPAVKQAETRVAMAQANLDQAELNLSYCKIYAVIDGVVTRRNVNPGNNVQVGQGLMAVRSLTEIWIDANFKETQLDWLRIGQPADLVVDMYVGRRVFKGRVSGFTMGTGSTLSLLPAENATGNFVKVVQRLPVRIDLVEPNPEDSPLFIGLSVTPYVHVNEQPTGPEAGKFLQPHVVAAAVESVAPNSTGAGGAAIPAGPSRPPAADLPTAPAPTGLPLPQSPMK